MKIFARKKMLYAIEIFFLIFIIIALIYSNIFTRKIISITLLLVALLLIGFIKENKNENIHARQVELLVLLTSALYIMLLYILGIYFGFYKSTVQFSIGSLKTFIIPYIVIIISSEIIRKKLYLKSDSIVSKILITVSFILLDVMLTTDIKNLHGIKEYVTVISFVFFSSIANNLLFNYIINRFKTIKANIIYRLFTTIYVFIIPITPDIYVFFESIIRMVIPYIIYTFLEKIYNRKNIIKSTKRKRIEIIFIAVTTIMVIAIVMLVSCKFTYGVLVIGSGSMTGTINKGDIILYKKYDDKSIKINEILVFLKEDITTVHRVINMKETTDGIKYYTKGDANIQKDNGYITKADIIGRVLYKVPYIGYLNLWLNDIAK